MEDVKALLGHLRHAKRSLCANSRQRVGLLPALRLCAGGDAWAIIFCADEGERGVFTPNSTVVVAMALLARYALIEEVVIAFDAIRDDDTEGVLAVIHSAGNSLKMHGALHHYAWVGDMPAFEPPRAGRNVPPEIRNAIGWAWSFLPDEPALLSPLELAGRRQMVLRSLLAAGIVARVEDRSGAMALTRQSLN